MLYITLNHLMRNYNIFVIIIQSAQLSGSITYVNLPALPSFTILEVEDFEQIRLKLVYPSIRCAAGDVIQ